MHDPTDSVWVPTPSTISSESKTKAPVKPSCEAAGGPSPHASLCGRYEQVLPPRGLPCMPKAGESDERAGRRCFYAKKGMRKPCFAKVLNGRVGK